MKTPKEFLDDLYNKKFYHDRQVSEIDEKRIRGIEIGTCQFPEIGNEEQIRKRAKDVDNIILNYLNTHLNFKQ